MLYIWKYSNLVPALLGYGGDVNYFGSSEAEGLIEYPLH